MLRVVVLFALIGVALGHMHLRSILTMGQLSVYYHPPTSATGNFDLQWVLGENGTEVGPNNFFAIGLQNGNAATAPASSADTSMYGPVGGGSEFFFIYGDSTNAYGLFRTLNNTQRPASGAQRNGRPPSPMQQLASNANASTSSDRIRSVSVSEMNGVTTYIMTITCGSNYFTNGANPTNILFSWGSVTNGEPGYHGVNRGWKQSSTGTLNWYILCGSNAGEITTGSTGMPATTSKSSLLGRLSVLTTILLALAFLAF